MADDDQDSTTTDESDSETESSTEVSVGNDSVTEDSIESFGSRIINSIKGVLIGLLFFFGSFSLLWWNEGHIAAEKDTLHEMAKVLIKIKSTAPLAKNNGKLVHTTATLSSQDRIDDNKILLPGAWLKLRRNVEMYQWVEKKESKSKKSVGGSKSTQTTYSYTKQWQKGREDSNRFKVGKGHENPQLPIEDLVAEVDIAKFGKFDGKNLLAMIEDYKPVTIKPEMLRTKGMTLQGKYILYKVNSPANKEPKIGDTRVSFEAVLPGTYSVLAEQVASQSSPSEKSGGLFGLTHYTSANGTKKLLIAPGTQDPKSMLKIAEDGAKTMTMLLRLVGFLMMFFGIKLILDPFATLLDFIPILGSIGRFAMSAVAIVISVPLTLITIVVAMIAHNPVVLTLVVAIVVASVGFWLWKRSQRPFVPTAGAPKTTINGGPNVGSASKQKVA